MIKKHITILEKNDVIGVLGVATDEKFAVVGNYTHGKPDIYLREFAPKDDGSLRIEEAFKEYRKAVKTSHERGYKIVYQGVPNYG